MAGMAGSQLPVVVSHGEGRAVYADHEKSALVTRQLQAMRYIDHRGAVASAYPFNPNGSPEGLAGVTSTDGRATIMMPHPERVVRAAQMSWHPRDWDVRYAGASPWMNLFHNARRWLK
jgi:phosphoribosylformylglycinamidine synthase